MNQGRENAPLRVRFSRVAGGLGVALIGAVAALAPASAAADPEAAWIELGPERQATVRAITEDARCPSMRVNGSGRVMNERAAPDPPDYDVLTCQKSIGQSANRIEVDGTQLQAPVGRVERIAVVGDTGCRMAGPGFTQACNDPAAWPFEQVADSIAEWNPELIVHVGDYHYREKPCPAGIDCAGSPYGYNWPAWDADFFSPAAKSLRAAPWVLLRGNHESCSRAGAGWFRFLEPRPAPSSCADFTDPYTVYIGRARLPVLDTSAANDFSPYNPQQYASQFAELDELVGPNQALLLTHKPIWGLAAINNGAGFAVTNISLEQASSNSLPGRVRAVVSGHLHNAEVFGFEGGRAPQLVIGNGGTMLDAQITAPIVGTETAGAKIVDALAESRFGFATMVREDGGWTLVARGPDGKAFARCPVIGKSAACKPG